MKPIRRGYKPTKGKAAKRYRAKHWLTCAEHIEAFRVNRKGRIAERKHERNERRMARLAKMTTKQVNAVIKGADI